ncbi:MAG TPA: DNA-processing protein DprA [Burkholderiaceae bacterium]
MQDAERRAWLRLSLTDGVSPGAARDLLTAFGLPVAIFEAGPAALARVAGESVATALLAAECTDAIERAQAWLDSDASRSLITLADADYPPLLLHLTDPPPLLYLQGRRELLKQPALAIVGSRNASRQGEANAEAFASHLAGCGLTIVSGLARGIDSAAHRGALGADAATIAVLGTGADIVYPLSNRALAGRIVQQGLLVSEYPLGTPAIPHNFPRRNRLIAATALGVLVVEAALPSGSLITARLAAELGREVMAIPGSIHSPLARGCHQLIRDGARLVESAQDVLHELQIETLRLPPSVSSDRARRDEPDLLRAVGFDPVDLDTLAQRTGLAPGPLSARLLELELTQDVERLAGNCYQRLRRS